MSSFRSSQLDYFLSKLTRRLDVNGSENIQPLADQYFIDISRYSTISSHSDGDVFVVTGNKKCIPLKQGMAFQSIWFMDEVFDCDHNISTIVPSTLICCPLSGATVVCSGYWNPSIYRIENSCSVFSDDTDPSRFLVPLLARSISHQGLRYVNTYQANLLTWRQICNLGSDYQFLITDNIFLSNSRRFKIPEDYGCGIITRNEELFVRPGSFLEHSEEGDYRFPGEIGDIQSQVFCSLSSWKSLYPRSIVV